MMRNLILSLVTFINVATTELKAQDTFVMSLRDSLLLEGISKKKRIEICNRLCVHYAKDSFNQAVSYGNQALDLSLKSRDKINEGIAKLNLANTYLYSDIYDQALMLALDALNIFHENGDKRNELEVNTILGWIYYDSGNPDMALQYHSKTTEGYKELDLELYATALNAVGLDYSLKNEHVKALEYFKESLRVSKQVGSITRISSSLNNIGMSESALGNYDEALEAISQSYKLSLHLNDPLKQAENLNQLGHVYILQKNYTEAEGCLIRARELIGRIGSVARKEKLLDNYEFTSILYQETEHHKKALEYLNNYAQLKEEIISNEKENKLAEINLFYTTQKKEQEIKFLESEKKIQTLQRDTMAGGILLLGIIAALVINRQRSIQRKERLIADTNERLMRKELERESIQREALTEKLNFKSTELTNFALHISQRNDLLRSFIDELRSLNLPASHESSVKLKKIVNEFINIQNKNKEAEDFHLTIESEYKDFFFHLSQQFPDLTKNEKRLCVQVRLNLSIKDIASINNISVKSVEMARYRLRKKFNLEHDANLTDFLREF